MSENEQRIIDDFYLLYMQNSTQTIRQTRWMNVPCVKLPQDLWVYQELIVRLKPDLIVETGTFLGGSTLFLAHMLELLGHGQVVSIDIQKLPRPQHPRIKYLHGSSTDVGLVTAIFERYTPKTTLVILDSDHHKEHVLTEMNLFAPHVSLNSYLIVEDTHMPKNPQYANFGATPLEATLEFLAAHPEFVVDTTCEKFLLSFNPAGYLKRIC